MNINFNTTQVIAPKVIDSDSFRHRIARAVLFFGKPDASDPNLLIFKEKTFHWQRKMVDVEGMMLKADVPSDLEKPEERFKRLKEKEQTGAGFALILSQRGLVESLFENDTQDHVTLLDQLDDYEDLITDQMTPYLNNVTFAELKELTELHTIRAGLDHVAVNPKFNDRNRLNAASKINSLIRQYSIVKDLFEEKERGQLDALFIESKKLFNEDIFNQESFTLLLAQINQILLTTNLEKQTSKLQDELALATGKHSLYFSCELQKANALEGFDRIVKLGRIREQFYAFLEESKNPSKTSLVRFKLIEFSKMISKYKALSDYLQIHLEDETLDLVNSLIEKAQKRIEIGDLNDFDSILEQLDECFFTDLNASIAIEKLKDFLDKRFEKQRNNTLAMSHHLWQRDRLSAVLRLINLEKKP